MADIWRRKYKEFGRRCAYCGKHLFTDVDAYMASTLDHIVPRKNGGLDDDDNRALACATCNTLKGSFDPRKVAPSGNKQDLIRAAREHIFKERASKVIEFLKYLETDQEV